MESCQRLDNSDLDILAVRNKLWKMVSLVVKVPPGSRKCNTIDFKHRDENLLERLAFLSPKLLLLKFKAGYWSIIDCDGQVIRQPLELKSLLK